MPDGSHFIFLEPDNTAELIGGELDVGPPGSHGGRASQMNGRP
jgi:hypothetical protein